MAATSRNIEGFFRERNLLPDRQLLFFDNCFLAAKGFVVVRDSRRLHKRGEFLLTPCLRTPGSPALRAPGSGAKNPSKILFIFTARSLLLKENGGRFGNKGGIKRYFLRRSSILEIY